MPEEIRALIENNYAILTSGVELRLEENIKNHLEASGIMFRIFHRIKDKEGIIKKLEGKYKKYKNEQRGLRDVFGIRIVLYFVDDIDICIKILKEQYEYIEKEHDIPDPETFKPQRINYVFRIPENEYLNRELMAQCMIDAMFEIQIRTIFSEGWHEIEHDLRYKNTNSWDDSRDLSRELNGVLATLEVCDSNILNICERLSHSNYKNRMWEAMVRNKFRLRFTHDPLNKELIGIIESNQELAKDIFRYERENLMLSFYQSKIPITYDNAIYIMNLMIIRDPLIDAVTPDYIRRRINNLSDF